jgi:tetratricopeptide (TPR) repeat protein
VENHKSGGEQGFIQRMRNNRSISQIGVKPKIAIYGPSRHGMSGDNGLPIFTEETMLSKIRIVPNLSKALVAGLVLGFIPWLVSGYLFPQSGRRASSPKVARASDAEKSGKPDPLLLPSCESARRLPPPSDENSTILTSGSPSEESLGALRNNEVSAESVVSKNSTQDPRPKTQDLKHGIPDIDIPDVELVFIHPAPQADSAKSEKTAAPSSAEKPTPSKTAGERKTPAKMPSAKTNENKSDAVPSPAAPPNHGSVRSEAAASRPAVQPMAVPADSEGVPAEPALLYPTTAPGISPPASSVALPVRSEQLESIARQADQEIRQGFELAGRGAYFAARSEFLAALRLVAQGLDTERQTTMHGKALAAGLTALREAEDFIPRGSMVEANLDIPALAASHVTPVLKIADCTRTTSLAALKSYLTYAQQKFAEAAGREFAGSMALRALGKMHDELAKNQNSEIRAAGPKAVVFYQAALLVAPHNYMAANDLGVLYARAGNLRDAREILEHSAAIGRNATVLNNLAAVYQRLGRNDLAARAKRESLLAIQAERTMRPAVGARAADGSIMWVAPEAFVENSPNLAAPTAVAGNPAAPQRTPGAVRQTPPAQPAANAFGGNNPHWSPNYPRVPVMGQAPSNGYQR